jgi:hypothetical protein
LLYPQPKPNMWRSVLVVHNFCGWSKHWEITSVSLVRFHSCVTMRVLSSWLTIPFNTLEQST